MTVHDQERDPEQSVSDDAQHRQILKVMTGLLAALFTAMLSTTIVSAALPNTQRTADKVTRLTRLGTERTLAEAEDALAERHRRVEMLKAVETELTERWRDPSGRTSEGCGRSSVVWGQALWAGWSTVSASEPPGLVASTAPSSPFR